MKKMQLETYKTSGNGMEVIVSRYTIKSDNHLNNHKRKKNLSRINGYKFTFNHILLKLQKHPKHLKNNNYTVSMFLISIKKKIKSNNTDS